MKKETSDWMNKVTIEGSLAMDNNNLRTQNELQNEKIQYTADFLEWLVDVYLNDGTTINELEEEFEAYSITPAPSAPPYSADYSASTNTKS